jgi:AAA domain
MSHTLLSTSALVSPTAKDMQLFMLLWGDSGSGKTTLAATAPGTKLFLMLDPGGELSLTDRDDIAVLSLTNETPGRLISQFATADPYGIGKILKDRPDIETVVLDSMTTLAYVALQNSVMINKSSIERPGMHGYTYRNASVLRTTVSLMRLCSEYKRHLILITHEGSADRNDEGSVVSVTMALSEGTANQVGLRFNEVWWVSDTGTERRIAVRPCRMRKPMKTRLFHSDKPEFVWHYNPDSQVGEGIADWYHAWQANKGRKLPLPARAASTLSRGGKR